MGATFLTHDAWVVETLASTSPNASLCSRKIANASVASRSGKCIRLHPMRGQMQLMMLYLALAFSHAMFVTPRGSWANRTTATSANKNVIAPVRKNVKARKPRDALHHKFKPPVTCDRCEDSVHDLLQKAE